MLTTFARIAKILKGLVEPRNWVEEAFGEISGGGGTGTETLIVTLESDGAGGYNTDYSVEEICSRVNNGDNVKIKYTRSMPYGEGTIEVHDVANVICVQYGFVNDSTTMTVVSILAQSMDYQAGSGWAVH